jgi:ubiquinone/menaquinone biosynthesis C-methylase UbiE
VFSLPFSEGEFDRVHAERLFQVLPKSEFSHVFSALDRVLTSKGRMVLVETDWGSASVNHSDVELERKLKEFFSVKLRPNGFAGRELLVVLKEKDYENVQVEVVPFVIRDFSETPFGDWLCSEALKQKIATKRQIEGWRSELEMKTREGTFLSCTNMILVAGSKK